MQKLGKSLAKRHMRVATSEHNPKTKALRALKRRVHEGSYSFRRSKSRPETSQNGPGIHENVQARPLKWLPLVATTYRKMLQNENQQNLIIC